MMEETYERDGMILCIKNSSVCTYERIQSITGAVEVAHRFKKILRVSSMAFLGI